MAKICKNSAYCNGNLWVFLSHRQNPIFKHIQAKNIQKISIMSGCYFKGDPFVDIA